MRPGRQDSIRIVRHDRGQLIGLAMLAIRCLVSLVRKCSGTLVKHGSSVHLVTWVGFVRFLQAIWGLALHTVSILSRCTILGLPFGDN